MRPTVWSLRPTVHAQDAVHLKWDCCDNIAPLRQALTRYLFRRSTRLQRCFVRGAPIKLRAECGDLGIYGFALEDGSSQKPNCVAKLSYTISRNAALSFHLPIRSHQFHRFVFHSVFHSRLELFPMCGRSAMSSAQAVHEHGSSVERHSRDTLVINSKMELIFAIHIYIASLERIQGARINFYCSRSADFVAVSSTLSGVAVEGQVGVDRTKRSRGNHTENNYDRKKALSRLRVHRQLAFSSNRAY